MSILTNEPEYRKLTVEDIEMAMNMNITFRDEFIAYDAALNFLNNPYNWLYVAILRGEIIGFLYGYELNRLDKMQNMLYINEVGIAPDFQRKGIGTKLLTQLKTECKQRNICKFFLSAYQNNVGANALYRKLGGEVAVESNGHDTNYYFPIR